MRELGKSALTANERESITWEKMGKVFFHFPFQSQGIRVNWRLFVVKIALMEKTVDPVVFPFPDLPAGPCGLTGWKNLAKAEIGVRIPAEMMKPVILIAACGCAALILSGCGQEAVAPVASPVPSRVAETVNTPYHPALSGMSRAQRQAFRIKETAGHLSQVIGILKKLEAGGGLELDSGARPDLAALENTLASIRQEARVEATESAAGYPHRSGGKLDALFTQVLELEKQVVWPEDSPERKKVAACLVAASEVFEAAVPLNRAEAGTAPGMGW